MAPREPANHPPLISLALACGFGLAVIASPAVLGALGLRRAAETAVIDPLLSLCLSAQPVSDPDRMSASWSLAPQIVLPMLLVALLYGRGAPRAGGATTPLQTAAFFGGLALLAVALVSPLCRMAATMASAHMVQHILIVALAPPLLVLGRPLATILQSGASLSLPAAAGNPGLVAMLYAAAIWLSHAPYIYESALLSPTFHLALLAFQLGTSLLFWNMQLQAILHPDLKNVGGAIMAALFTFMHTGLLGALLTFAGEPWYPVFGLGPQAWGLTALEDQQLAGLIMWVPMAAVYLAAGLAMVAQLLKASETSS